MKMLEYRAKMGGNHDEDLPSQDAYVNTGSIPAYMELAELYGMPQMDIGNLTREAQSIREEYQAYITAVCSSIGTDILKFWEASATFMTFENY
jgi:hypothetical protein